MRNIRTVDYFPLIDVLTAFLKKVCKKDKEETQTKNGVVTVISQMCNKALEFEI